MGKEMEHDFTEEDIQLMSDKSKVTSKTIQDFVNELSELGQTEIAGGGMTDKGVKYTLNVTIEKPKPRVS